MIIQLLLPIRHHFIEGNVFWTEEGHRLSWRMMLRERSGYIIIKIKDNKTNKAFIYDFHKNLSSKQAKQLATKPDFIWQYCQKIKEEYKDQDISIYIDNVATPSFVNVVLIPYTPTAANPHHHSHRDAL